MPKCLRLSAVFFLSVLVFAGLAVYRPGDLVHVLAVADETGGRVRHGVHLPYGKERYTVLITGRARLPQPTDLHIRLEGASVPPKMTVFSSYPPPVDLGLHTWPGFDGVTLRDFGPGEKFSLWVVLEPEPRGWPGAGGSEGKVDEVSAETAGRSYLLALYDSAERKVLAVPITFGEHGRSRGAATARRSGGRH